MERIVIDLGNIEFAPLCARHHEIQAFVQYRNAGRAAMSGMVSSQGYEDMPGLYIRNTTGGGTFVEQARKALLKLRSKSRGKRLLELSSTLCHEKNVPITIEPAIGFYGQTGPGWSESDNLVRWNTKTQPKQSGNEDQLNDIPTFIIPPEAGDVFRL